MRISDLKIFNSKLHHFKMGTIEAMLLKDSTLHWESEALNFIVNSDGNYLSNTGQSVTIVCFRFISYKMNVYKLIDSFRVRSSIMLFFPL